MSIKIHSKKAEKENTVLWKKEAKRLKAERDSLLAKLNSVSRYKQDYEDLISETKLLKERYQNLIDQMEDLFQEYKAALERL